MGLTIYCQLMAGIGLEEIRTLACLEPVERPINFALRKTVFANGSVWLKYDFAFAKTDKR